MARLRKDKRGSKKTSLNIQFLVEGETEKYFIPDFLRNNGYSLKINITTMNGGGYFEFIKNIQKNSSTYDVIIVVTDLDRAGDLSGELPRLKQLISLLEKENDRNNIFLTYKDIETFIKACLPGIGGIDLDTYLGYKKGSKGKLDIYRRLQDKDIDFQKAKDTFKDNNLYYKKKDFVNSEFREDNIRKIQSNLLYFIDYINKVTNER